MISAHVCEHLSSAQRYRWKEIILHSVHRSNNLLKHLFVALLIHHLDLLHKHKSPINLFSIKKYFYTKVIHIVKINRRTLHVSSKISQFRFFLIEHNGFLPRH